MKTAFRRLLAAAHALVLSSALSACMLVGGDTLVAPGGAEDFPNTVETLGKIAVSDVSSGASWEQVQEITLPEMPRISGLDSLNVTPPLSKRGLAKASAGTGGYQYDSLQVDFNKTLEFIFGSRVYVYLFLDTPEMQRRDTVICRYLRPVNSLGEILGKLDSIKASPLTFLQPRQGRGVIRPRNVPEWQSYKLSSLDDSGAMDLAEYTTQRTNPDNSTLRKRVRIYGPDSAYAAPDAVPEEYEILRRGPAGDTLEWTKVSDADWDRKLWGDDFRGVVDLQVKVRNPESQPALSRMHVYMRADLRHSASLGDSLRQLSYLEQRWLRNGRSVSFSLQGAGSSGALLRPNDSARMIVDTVYALADSMIKYTAVYNLQLGAFTDRMQEHKLLGYSIVKLWRAGPLFSTVSLFAPAAPVPMGQAGFEGQMSSTAAYTNKDTVITTGTIGSAGFDLTVQQVKQDAKATFKVLLDAAGNLLKMTPVLADTTATAKRTAKRAPKP